MDEPATQKIGFFGCTPRPWADWSDLQLEFFRFMALGKLRDLDRKPWWRRTSTWEHRTRPERLSLRLTLDTLGEEQDRRYVDRETAGMGPVEKMRWMMHRIGLVAGPLDLKG